MANNKKFIVKNGLLTGENVVIGSTTDAGTGRLQVTGNAAITGAADISQSNAATPSLKVTNDGTGSALVARFEGDAQSLDIVNFTSGDYSLTNPGQDNGIRFYDNTSGVEIMYNGSVDLDFNSAGIDFKREPSYNGNVFWNAGNDGAGSGLDADLLDGLDSLQFLRSDQDDTMNGSLTITGDLTVSGNTTYVNTEQILLSDNIITLNADFTAGSPTEDSGFEILRGSAANSSLIWDETNDWFKLISAGTDLGRIITTADEGSGNGFDADTVDGLEASQFLRSDANDTTTGNLTVEGDLTVGDGNGTASIRMSGSGGIESIAATGGEIGFLDSTFNFAIKVKTDDDIEVRNDILAERFIDKDATGYFAHPGDTSVFNTLGLDSDLFHNGDTDTKLQFDTDLIRFNTGGGTRLTITDTSSAFTHLVTATDLDVFSGGSTGEMNVGKSANERFNFHVSGNQGYIRYYQDETDSATNHSVNFEIQSSGTYPHKFNFNKNINLGTNSIEGASGIFTGDVYASKYWDSDDVTHYANFGNSGVSLYFAGRSEGGSGTAALPTYTFKDDPDTGMFRGAANRLDFTAGGQVQLQITNAYTFAPNSFRAPVYYDSDNVAYYGDFGGTSVMNTIDLAGSIRHNNDTNTYINFPAADQFQIVTGGATRLQATNSYVLANNEMRSPRFVDQNNNAYYGDFASTSIMSRIDIDDYIRHRGDENTYFGFAAADTFRVWTNGVQRLNIDNDSADFAQNVFAPRFYTDDYLVHNGDTDTYIGFDNNDTFSVYTAGTERLLINNTNAEFYVAIGIDDFITHNGDLDTKFGFDANDNFGVWTANVKRLEVDSNGQVGIGTVPAAMLDINKPTAVGNNPFTAGNTLFRLGDNGTADLSIRTDASGNIYLVNDNGGDYIWYDTSASGKFAILNSGDVIANGDSVSRATSDGSPNFLASLAGNKFHVNGGIALNGKSDALSIYAADGSNTAINEATFLAVNELGFSAGGGFYMDDTSEIKIRGNKNLNTTGTITGGNVYAARFYDSDDSNYYVDPNGDSQMNTIDIDDYIRHRGDTNTYLGFSAADTFKIFTGGSERVNIDNNSADFAQNIYAPAYYDSNDNNYYLDPASTSQLNRIDINDYIRHRGDTDNYFGFAAADTFRVFTGGVQRVNVDNNSADFAVNVYAPAYYDSDNNSYYLNPASTSVLNRIDVDDYIRHNGDTDTYMGFSGADTIVFNAANATRLTINGTSVTSGVNVYAPRYYDSDNNAYYLDPASTSITNIMRANQFQIDGSAYVIDSPSGDYGSIRVAGAKGGWAGYAINDDWVFMSNGYQNAGIYNDTRNEWHIYMQDNNFTRLYANGTHQIGAENGFGSAANSMRSPVYYGPSSTAYYLDLDNGNTSNSLRIQGRIDRIGFANDAGNNNKIITAEDRNHWIWNTANNWGMFWATSGSPSYSHFSSGNANELVFVGGGNVRASLDLDNGNLYAQGEMFAGNFNLAGGNESVPLSPVYGSGLADFTLFDGTKYWEKRVIQSMTNGENNVTSTTSEYVKNNNGPFASTYALRTSAYRQFDSDYIEVEPGDEIYGEIAARYISGSGGVLYMGVRRYDKDKRPIASNDGITYFVVSANNVTSTNWQTFSGHHTLPTSHAAFNGSDGGAVKYIRLILLINYNAGGALREFGPPILKRTNAHSNLRSPNMYADRFYDRNDNAFYLDPASTSKLNTVDASNFRDRDNTARFMNPATGGNVQGTWNWNNGTIDNLNNLTFNDPGPSEGIKWKGGNEWQIYESPDNLSTNSGGNLQFTSGSGNGTMRMRMDTNGDVWAGRYFRASRFYDSNDGSYYADPAGSSIFANLYLRTGGLKMQRNYGDNAIWWNAGTDANHVLWNHYYGGPNARGAAGSGGFDGMLWNTYQGLRIRGGSSGAYNIARFSTDGAGNGNGHYVQLYSANVEQLGTRAGYGFAPNQMRSPIFYDSNDTNYYGNFASTSRMNTINANMYSLNDGWDIYDDDSDTMSIRSNNGDHGEIIFRDSNSTDCGRIYFDDDNHWGFKSPDNEWQIYLERNARTILYYNGGQQARTQNGYFEANNQLRTPIFYDSNDTAFYVDPNADSRFRRITVLETITGNVTGYAGSLLRKDNRIIEPNEDTSGRLVFGFTSYNNNNTSPWADYLHLRSYTDASGGSDNLLMFKKSGFGMRLWQQSWNSGTAYATSRDIALYNENNSGNLYAARFYDAGDTSRYMDPNGRSQINDLRINGGNDIEFATSSGNIRGYIQATETNDEHLIIATSGGEDIAFKDGGLGGQRNFLIRGDGNTFTTGTHYAQRFTDSNDGNYYGDFASTSVMNNIDNRGEIYNDGWFRNDTGGRGLYNTAYAMHWYATSTERWRAYSTANVVSIDMHTSGNNRRGRFYANNSNEIGILSQDDGWAVRATNSVVDIYHNLYAPIMYDRNSTGYYVNPASQSHMNTLTLAGNRIGFINSSFDAEIRVSDDNPNGTGAIFTFWGDQVEYNAEVRSEIFYATRHMYAPRYYDINNTAFYIDPASTSIMNNVRADIYYDRNDTAYYWNGASTNSSRFLGVNNRTMAYMALPGHTRNSGEYYRARPRQTGDTNYWTGAMGWGTVDMNQVGTWGSGFIDSWSNPANQPSGTSHWVGTQAFHYRSSNTNGYGWQMVGGPIENLRFRSSWGGWRTWRTIPVLNVNNGNGGAMYANIYYDTDNTGFYCDPSSFSNFNTGMRATEIYARNWFRNDNSREGLYNQATGVYAYSYQNQYYAITGNNNNSSMSLQLRSTYNGNMCMWMYGDRTYAGHLNDGGQWHLRWRQDDGYSPNMWFVESSNESWTGNPGNDIGKIEYHANRFYIVAGANSNRIVQFRRDGSDRSYVDNNGLYVGTATSARWADLAERYSADDIYEPGTVMGIDLDGDAEITIWREGLPMVGVISTNPAVQMNDMGIEPGSESKKAKMNPFIALKGRIPCQVSGEDGAITKGMWLIPDPESVGKAKGVPYGTPGINSHEIIGIALSDSKDGEVEVKV